MTRVFLDANVFVAAAGSSKGGSALLLEMGKRGLLEIVSSHLALLEAERNIRKKLPGTLKRFHRLLEEVPLLIVPTPSAEEIRRCQTLINEKDAPILAAAASSRSDFLITLDQRHFLSGKLRQAHFPFKVATPRDFFSAFRS